MTVCALSLAQQSDLMAQTTQAPVPHGDAALALAEVLYRDGRLVESDAEARRAIDCFERKGATAWADRARGLIAAWNDGRPA